MRTDAVYPYHLLKAAADRFGRKPIELDAEEMRAAQAVADRALFLETRILETAAAQKASLPEGEAQAARDALAARYEDETAFREDLSRAGVTEAALLEALRRQLRVEAVLETVASGAEAPNDAEIVAFYETRIERFTAPERRRLRHVLVTINPAFPENRPAAARARIEIMRARIVQAPSALQRFAEEAARSSECPSALDGGAIGLVARGTLAPALEGAAFALTPGEVSGVVESEMGLHLVLCEEILPARRAPLEQARPQIVDALLGARRTRAKRAWIKDISRTPGAAPEAEAASPRPREEA